MMSEAMINVCVCVDEGRKIFIGEKLGSVRLFSWKFRKRNDMEEKTGF